MKPWKLAGTTAIMALIAANAALADVTPEEVWQNWQELYAASGSTVTTGSVAREGDTLVITDLKSSTDTLNEKSDATLAELRLQDVGDGTVKVTMSDEISFSSASSGDDDGADMAATGMIKMAGMTGTVSGSVDDMAYTFVAPKLDITVSPTEDGKPAGKVDMLLSDTTATYKLSGPVDAKILDGSFAAASAALNVAVKDDTSDVSGTINVADVSGKMAGNFAGLEEEELSDAFAKGFAVDMALSYGALLYDFDSAQDGSPSKLVGGSEGGAVQLVLDAAKMAFSGAGKNVSATFSSADLPVPEVKLSYAESAMSLTIPIGKSDDAQDFAFLTKIVDLKVSEEIWAMIDPTAALPHDPATLVIDTSGTAKLNADLMADSENNELDGELHSLDVNELRASAAGAELTGSGAFTFDNSDMVTYGGFPVPTGSIDLKLVGGNGLLDKLVALGVVSDEEAMGARMMIAMFANSGTGKDELTSKLEFKDKHFFANGQQLQ